MHSFLSVGQFRIFKTVHILKKIRLRGCSIFMHWPGLTHCDSAEQPGAGGNLHLPWKKTPKKHCYRLGCILDNYVLVLCVRNIWKQRADQGCDMKEQPLKHRINAFHLILLQFLFNIYGMFSSQQEGRQEPFVYLLGGELKSFVCSSLSFITPRPPPSPSKKQSNSNEVYTQIVSLSFCYFCC